MKVILNIDGVDIEAHISEEELDKIGAKHITGYERVLTLDGCYYYIDDKGEVVCSSSTQYDTDKRRYEIANYFTDPGLSANKSRERILEDRLERFAVEHREIQPDWNNPRQHKWYIYYDYETNEIGIASRKVTRGMGKIYFDSEKTAVLAIEKFYDELIWYFTEYKDSL